MTGRGGVIGATEATGVTEATEASCATLAANATDRTVATGSTGSTGTGQAAQATAGAAPWPPPHEVARIVVFRALVLGDLLCATPALRALRAAHPRAHIALVGLPTARALVERLASVDEFIEFPGHPGLPEVDCDVRALPAFLGRLQARRFDLALQLHGSGGIVNPLVATFGARWWAGFATPGVWRPQGPRDRGVAWPENGHEIERMLALTDALGAPRRGTAIDFPVEAADREALHELLPACPERFVCVHAGAQLASRRWPTQRFAQVADALVDDGFTVLLTGTAQEAELVAQVEAGMQRRCINLAGRTSVWTLGALLERAACLVCNDTGVSHVAAALGRPSVVVSCGADVSRWAPLDATRHAVMWQPLACRPCGHRVCPYAHECASAVEPRTVTDRVRALLQAP